MTCGNAACLSRQFLLKHSASASTLRADSHYASRFRSVTVPSSFRQNSLCPHCPPCSVTYQNSMWWRWCKTVHIIGIEQVQTGPDPFRHVNNSRSATASERNWGVTETFLWTSLFNLLKPEEYLIHQKVQHSRILHSATLCLCVLYLLQNK
jgi:hypothetical protein